MKSGHVLSGISLPRKTSMGQAAVPAMLLLLALAIRVPVAFWPNVNHPDEIYQYLEPAWRLLGHDAIVTWEWRAGIRSWLVPTLLAGPVSLGDWMAPGGQGAFIVPRLLAVLTSLSIVLAAWRMGARVSRMHAVVTALVTATWFELVYFAPHTLTEPLATALIVPAALLLMGDPSRRQLVFAGGLLTLAFVFRFQYGPSIAVFVIGACWRQWRNAIPLAVGAATVVLVTALVDVLSGATPFAWLFLNVELNLLHDRASEFGITAAAGYVQLMSLLWSGATLLIFCALWRGWTHAPLLIIAALVNLGCHSLIPHKEYRFIFLSVVLLIIAAALGSADWAQMLAANPRRRRWALPVICGGWILLSLGLSDTSKLMQSFWSHGIGPAHLAAELSADAERCGVALYVTSYDLMPGHQRLAANGPLYAFARKDPMTREGLPAALRQYQRGFNRIIAPPDAASELPPAYARRSCAEVDEGETACIFARSGRCDRLGATPFDINDVLTRTHQ